MEKRKKPAFTSWRLLVPTSTGDQRDWKMTAQFSVPYRGFEMRSSQVSAGTQYPVWLVRRELHGEHSPMAAWWRQQWCAKQALLALNHWPVGQDDPGPQHRALSPRPHGRLLPTWHGAVQTSKGSSFIKMQWAVPHCYLGQVTANAGEEVPPIHTRPDLLRTWRFWEPDLQMLKDKDPPAGAISPCLMVT